VTVLVLCAAVVVLSALLVVREVQHARCEKDLLDRLMARNFSEYSAHKANEGRERRPTRVLTDEQMAAREQARREALKA
jgi:hypothetical protein